MTRKPISLLLPLALLVLLPACDRSSRGAPAPTTSAAPASTATVAAPADTVALSGAIADLPVGTTPDALGSPADEGRIIAGSSVTAMPPARPPARRAPPAAPTRGPIASRPSTSPRPAGGETAAMREFREAQEQRDRELLERDLADVRRGVATRETGTDNGAPYEEAAVDDRQLDRANSDDSRFDPRDPPPEEDFGNDGLPPEDAFQEEPFEEEPFYEPGLDEEYPEDLPPEDDLQYDPATGTWR